MLPLLISYLTTDQEKVIADLRLQNAQSARTYSVHSPLPSRFHTRHTTASVCVLPGRPRALPLHAVSSPSTRFDLPLPFAPLCIFATIQGLRAARQCYDPAAAQWSGLQVLLTLLLPAQYPHSRLQCPHGLLLAVHHAPAAAACARQAAGRMRVCRQLRRRLHCA